MILEPFSQIEPVCPGIEVVGFEVQRADSFTPAGRFREIERFCAYSTRTRFRPDVELVNQRVPATKFDREPKGQNHVARQRSLGFEQDQPSQAIVRDQQRQQILSFVFDKRNLLEGIEVLHHGQQERNIILAGEAEFHCGHLF